MRMVKGVVAGTDTPAGDVQRLQVVVRRVKGLRTTRDGHGGDSGVRRQRSRQTVASQRARQVEGVLQVGGDEERIEGCGVGEGGMAGKRVTVVEMVDDGDG